MRTTSIFTLFLFTVSLSIFLPHTAAVDVTKWGLPEGAVARFGKGGIYEITYSPDGSLLAVASARSASGCMMRTQGQSRHSLQSTTVESKV